MKKFNSFSLYYALSKKRFALSIVICFSFLLPILIFLLHSNLNSCFYSNSFFLYSHGLDELEKNKITLVLSEKDYFDKLNMYVDEHLNELYSQYEDFEKPLFSDDNTSYLFTMRDYQSLLLFKFTSASKKKCKYMSYSFEYVFKTHYYNFFDSKNLPSILNNFNYAYLEPDENVIPFFAFVPVAFVTVSFSTLTFIADYKKKNIFSLNRHYSINV